MPRALNLKALTQVKESSLPEARPPRKTQMLDPSTGSYTYGEDIPGEAIPGSLPHIEIPHYEYPKCVYKYPHRAWVPRIVVIDGHGNKAWQWVALEASVKVVGDKKELAEALKAGYKEEPFLQPAQPDEDPEAAALKSSAAPATPAA